MNDEDVSTALDYLGRDQPLGSKRVTSLAAAGGGGNVTAPVTSAADPGQRVQGGPGGGLSKQPSTSGSLQDLQKAMGALGFSEKVLKLASPGFAPTVPGTTAANLGHETAVRDLGLDPGQFNELGEQGFGMASQAELHGATLGAETGAQTAAETGAETGSTVGGAIGQASSTLSAVLPYVQAAYDIYGRAEGNMDPEGQAVLAAIEILGAVGAPATGGMSAFMGMLLSNVLGDSFENLTHAQREQLDVNATGVGFRDLFPRLHGAQSIDDIVAALGKRDDGWLGQGRHTVTANGTDISDQNALRAALQSASSDPSKISFGWNQGIAEDQRQMFEGGLNNAVRQALGVLRANELGYAPATDYMRVGKGDRARYLLGKEGDLSPAMAEGTPTGGWASNDWARVQSLLDDMAAGGIDLDALGLGGARDTARRGDGARPSPPVGALGGGDTSAGVSASAAPDTGPDAAAGATGEGDAGDE